MKMIHTLTLILVLLGGLNLGFIGLTGSDMFVSLFGDLGITTLVYVLATLSTFYHVFPMLMTHVSGETA